MAEFFKDLFEQIQSLVEAVKVVDPYEGGIRICRGVIMEKKLPNRKIVLREKTLTEVYETNMLDAGLPTHKREKNKLFKTLNPFVRPEYGADFRKDFFGRAVHKDRYTEVLPPGAWFLIPERYFGIMRIAALPINVQTMDIKELDVNVSDYDPNIGAIVVDAVLTYLVIDVKKAYVNATQYNDLIHTKAEKCLAEIAKNNNYNFWKGNCEVSSDLAKVIDKNNAVGLIQGMFKQDNVRADEKDIKVWSHNEKVVPYNPKKKAKNIDDLLDLKKIYEGPIQIRSNTNLLALQLREVLNYELTKNYGILITSVGIKEGVPTKPKRMLHSGIPSEISVINTNEKQTTNSDYE